MRCLAEGLSKLVIKKIHVQGKRRTMSLGRNPIRLGFVASIIVSFLLTSLPAHAQNIEWVRQFGTNRKDEGVAIAKGPTGVYVTGTTAGIFPGETALPNDVDVFVSRYDEQGNSIWSRQFGSATLAQDYGTGVATDQTGVYVVGYTDGALPGQTSLGSTDAFIRKYSPDGNLLWTRQFGTDAQDYAAAVATDGTGVYVVGRTQGNIVTGGPAPNEDAFIRRYDPNGTVVWTRQFGSADGEQAFGVATDSTGIYVAGTTGGDLAGSVGGRDGFLRKYDAGGNALWTRQFGTNTTDDLYAVAAGSQGVYVVGDTVGNFPGQTKVGGLYDAYLMKFDVSGTQQWVREFGTMYEDWLYGVAVGASSVVVGGFAEDPLVPGNTGTALVRLYDFDGGVQGTIQFGNTAAAVATGVAADVTGGYVVGNKSDSALGQTPLGDLDTFAMKITLPAPTSLAFSITNFSGLSTTSDGTGPLSVGHAKIETSAGTTPSGVAIFGYRQNGVLVTEAGVPDSPLITSGRIYGEVSAARFVNTGLAIANPNNQPATVTFTLVNATGATVKSDSRTIGPNSQVAGFLTEGPYSVGSDFQGTVSFTSTAPVGVIALRSLVNERSDFLLTTLPVIDLSKGASNGTQVVPHFAVGDGWGTQIILVNPTDAALAGTVQFFGPGSPTAPASGVTVTIDGTPGNTGSYNVAARSSQKITVTAAALGLTYGSVRVIPSGGGAVPTPLVIFGYKPGPNTLSEAGVPVITGTAFRMYVEAAQAPVILSGIAVANTTNTQATVNFELLSLQGTLVATSPPRTLPASGQLVGYLSDFFPNLPQPFQGVLHVTTTAGGISVVALRQRYNERGDYLITTTPPTLETSIPTATARSFPHFVNGGGWTTQFILFSGTTAQTASGNVRFLRQDGSALPVTLR
jgi:Beta-propeller repeat